MAMDDLAIVDAVLNGDTDAYDQLVLRHQRQVTGLITRMMRSVNDAADIAQQVFIKAYQKLHTFKRESRFKTWLFAIAINMVRNEMRSRKRRGYEIDVVELNPGIKPGLEKRLIEQQRSDILRKSLDDLPDRQKEVVVLRINQELPFAEIAGILGITENSAKVNYHHAVKRLKNELKGVDTTEVAQ